MKTRPKMAPRKSSPEGEEQPRRRENGRGAGEPQHSQLPGRSENSASGRWHLPEEEVEGRMGLL